MSSRYASEEQNRTEHQYNPDNADKNEVWRGSGEEALVRDPVRGSYYPDEGTHTALQHDDTSLQTPVMRDNDVLSRSPQTLTRQQMLDTGLYVAADARTDSQTEAVAEPAIEQMEHGRLGDHPYAIPDDALSQQSFDHHEQFADTGNVMKKDNGRDTSAHLARDIDAERNRHPVQLQGKPVKAVEGDEAESR